MTIADRLAEKLALTIISKEILKSTCQFYKFKEGTTGLPIPNGCGILLKYNHNYYCLSNAHVLGDKNLGETFILLGGSKTLKIGGQYFFQNYRNQEKEMMTHWI